MIFMVFLIGSTLFVINNPHDLPLGPVKSQVLYERMAESKKTEKTAAEINYLYGL